MKYSLDIKLITNNAGIRNAVKNILPSDSDPKIWPDEYIVTESEEENGDKFVYATLPFHDKTERDNFRADLKGLGGVIHACLSGSYIRRLILVGHEEGETGKCIPEDIEEV